MADFYVLSPGVYGQMGPRTRLDNSVHPPLVHRLHFVLDDRPLDDLHTSFPCYMVSEAVARRVEGVGLSGVTLADVEAEWAQQYARSHPNDPVPGVKLLRVSGQARRDDFGLNEHGRLVVSARALGELRKYRLESVKVYDVDHAPTPEEEEGALMEELRKKAAARRAGRTGKR